jgi:hypothetical protein
LFEFLSIVFNNYQPEHCAFGDDDTCLAAGKVAIQPANPSPYFFFTHSFANSSTSSFRLLEFYFNISQHRVGVGSNLSRLFPIVWTQKIKAHSLSRFFAGQAVCQKISYKNVSTR